MCLCGAGLGIGHRAFALRYIPPFCFSVTDIKIAQAGLRFVIFLSQPSGVLGL